MPPRLPTLLWPCVFVFSRWLGSSADIICSCIIIQATASPQGSPAETKPLSPYLSIYLSPPSFLFLSQGCRVWLRVTPVMDEHNLRLSCMAQDPLWFQGLSLLRDPISWFRWNAPPVTHTAMKKKKCFSHSKERKEKKRKN